MTTDELGSLLLPDRPTAEVMVCIGLKDWPGAAPSQAWVGQFLVPEAELANLRREAEEIAQAAELPYQVREERGRTSWGADSGEVVRLALFVADSGGEALIGAAVMAFLKLLASRASKRGMPEYESRKTLSRTEAEDLARWTVVSHYARDFDGLDPLPKSDDELTPIGHSHDTELGAWTIVLRDVHGATYRVQFGHLDGLPTVKEIGRWASGATPS
ncbi:hypothetical protein KBX53_24015 [Micromonospora sp. M51]|uniref:hypothetical protein n=1 Tax=Micromonospora sp. M51 TaxID=2824889 RepID=UPI001B36514E|nr:hypothetical protein [Micromonospora sp. M51]MBQ1013954.1 hypothetical protein [Micromonospora sp. M51]